MMGICSLCGRISGSGQDHLDCVERRRVELLEDEDFRRGVPEGLDARRGDLDLAPEIRAVLDHMTRKRDED